MSSDIIVVIAMLCMCMTLSAALVFGVVAIAKAAEAAEAAWRKHDPQIPAARVVRPWWLKTSKEDKTWRL